VAVLLLGLGALLSGDGGGDGARVPGAPVAFTVMKAMAPEAGVTPSAASPAGSSVMWAYAGRFTTQE